MCGFAIAILSLLSAPALAEEKGSGFHYGGTAMVHTRPGNLSIAGVNTDLFLFGQYGDSTRGFWRVAVGYNQPHLPDPDSLPHFESVSLWLQRGGSFNTWKIPTRITGGLGFVDNIQWKSDGGEHIGSMGVLIGIEVPVLGIKEMELDFTMAYIGTMLPGTMFYADRFGIGLMMIY